MNVIAVQSEIADYINKNDITEYDDLWNEAQRANRSEWKTFLEVGGLYRVKAWIIARSLNRWGGESNEVNRSPAE